MKIFITGGSGFIGKHVVNKLAKEGHSLMLLIRNKVQSDYPLIRGDLSDISLWYKKLSAFAPECAIHLAWEGIPDYSSNISITNLVNGLRLYQALVKIGCKNILTTGSCFEYGNAQGRISEEYICSQDINSFAAAKRALYSIGSKISEESETKFLWARLFYVYGPGQRNEALIPSIIHSLQAGILPELKNPLSIHDYIYVKDVADAIIRLLLKGKNSGIYNIASGKTVTVRQIMQIIAKKYGINLPLKQSFVHINSFYGNTEKINKETGWFVQTSLQQGINETIKYYE
jgi:UDP-glucose 4-epimerase